MLSSGYTFSGFSLRKHLHLCFELKIKLLYQLQLRPLAYCLNILFCLCQARSLIRPTEVVLFWKSTRTENKTKHKFEKKVLLFVKLPIIYQAIKI